MNIHLTLHADPEAVTRIAAESDRAVILTDSNVAPLLPQLLPLPYPVITIPAGEQHKTLATCTEVWRAMSHHSMTRHSMLINIGGGMVTDLGSFCAATYMRGIRFVNVATTLLGAVDASIGGKTGVDLDAMKNRIGLFAHPEATFIPLDTLRTLPEAELLSGYAEMVKTGYITSSYLTDRLLDTPPLPLNTEGLLPLVRECLDIKAAVVSRDPRERGERKTLNFGHTAGHAFEQLRLSRHHPIPHGEAVAHGILVALILSHMQLDFPSRHIYRYADWLGANYPPIEVRCDDYDRLLTLMLGDKKNQADGRVRFVLLSDIGDCRIDCTPSPEEIKNALDIYRDLTGQ